MMFNNTIHPLVARTKILVSIIIFFIIVLFFSSSFMLYSHIRNADAVERESNYNNYTDELVSATEDILTETYMYIATGETAYYDRYIEEVYTNKTREKAVKKLLDLGVTTEEKKLLSQTLELSNNLVATDMAAFELLEDKKEEEAKELIFNDYNEDIRQEITDNYDTIYQVVNDRKQAETTQTFKVVKMSYVINVIVVVIIIIASVLLLRTFYQLREESDTDSLTGFYNRNRYKEKIKATINENPEKFGALLYCDIDNFKFINDRFGHQDGDKYITEVSNRLRSFEGETSILARPSGDEFVVYIHGFDSREQLEEIIDSKLREARNAYFKTSSLVEEKIRFSAGVAVYPTDTKDVEMLLEFSDYSLMKMKRSSKGETAYYEKNNFEKSNYAIANRGYVDDLIEKETLDFAMQPIVDARTYDIYAYEALMRPQDNVIKTPYLLLQLAKEETKLGKIERLVFKKVLEKVNNNIDLLQNKLVFINSIADQLLSKEELDIFEEQYPGIFKNIVVEVTEQEYVGEELIKMKVDMLRTFGARIALDDYGAGYSNEFTLLSGLYDIIKIDMKLIRDIDIDVKRQEIVKSIIRVAELNNCKVLAEGVETEQEVEILKHLGVDYFQGYYFGKPDLEIKPLSDDILKRIV